MKKLFNHIVKMKRWKQVMLVLVLWAIWGLIDVNNWQKAPARDIATFAPYQDSAGMVVRLSEQSTQPYLHQGKVQDVYPKKYLYEKIMHGYPIVNFPTVLDCLQKSEWNKTQPDLTKFDWNKMDLSEDLAVCLFRIASSYEKPEHMKKWLEINGAGAAWLRKIEENDNVSYIISDSWHCRESGLKIHTTLFMKLLHKFPVPLLPYGEGVDIRYNSSSNVIGANHNVSIE